MKNPLKNLLRLIAARYRRQRESDGENNRWQATRRLTEKLTRISCRDEDGLDCLRKRTIPASGIMIFFIAVIITRLWYLQVQHGEEYRKQAESNRVRSLDVIAPRGNILDRRNRPIVTNRPTFNVVWIRGAGALDDDLLKRMARILDVEITDLLAEIRRASGSPRHLPIRLATDIDWETVAYIENNRMQLPGIQIEIVPQRVYHYGNLASHLLGYLGEISKKELKKVDPAIYHGGDLIGKMGIEKLREEQLRGEKGRKYMEVNALGFEQRRLKGIEPLPGNDLQLTIDIDLQIAAEQMMAENDKAGAVVVMDVNNGRLLTLVSAPSLSLEDFSGRISTEVWNSYLKNPRHPLLNKIVQGQYPPGSTYKIVTALAGLAEGVITPETVIYCPGHYKLGRRTYRCWKKVGHGAVSLNRALAESCDVYFYQVGQRLGVDRLARYAHMFGLGERTGIEMEYEKRGLVPTAAWKKKVKGVPWQDGETLSVAIGQGFDLATPIQICAMTAALANGGTLYRPQVVESVRDPDGRIVREYQPEIKRRFSNQGRNLELIRRGLVAAVNAKHGTGRRARLEGITVGGKTGTAQVVRIAQYKHLKEEEIPYRYRDHAWFTCFAPAENPEIAVTVLVEHGLHGGSGAAPVARTVLEKYFADRLAVEENIPLPTSGESGR